MGFSSHFCENFSFATTSRQSHLWKSLCNFTIPAGRVPQSLQPRSLPLGGRQRGSIVWYIGYWLAGWLTDLNSLTIRDLLLCPVHSTCCCVMFTRRVGYYCPQWLVLCCTSRLFWMHSVASLRGRGHRLVLSPQHQSSSLLLMRIGSNMIPLKAAFNFAKSLLKSTSQLINLLGPVMFNYNIQRFSS